MKFNTIIDAGLSIKSIIRTGKITVVHLVSRRHINGRDGDVLSCLRGADWHRWLRLPRLRRGPPARALRGPALLRHSQLAAILRTLAIIRASSRRCPRLTTMLLSILSSLVDYPWSSNRLTIPLNDAVGLSLPSSDLQVQR